MLKEILSLQHPLVKHLVKLRQNRDYRFEHQSVVISGVKPVEDVGLLQPVKTMLVYDKSFIPKGIKADEIVIVNEEVMKKASGMQQPEGIMAEFKMPKFTSLSGKKFIIAIDGVNDPGNLGAILRSALALNWEGAFILPDSCDPYNDKALKAARGATFHLPLEMGSWKDLAKLVEEGNMEPLLADTTGTPLPSLKKERGVLLVLSNEAHGPSEQALKLCKKITIPMSGKMESLNVSVAGGILMYTLRQSELG